MTVSPSQALPQREQRRPQALPAPVPETGLGCVLRRLDRLHAPEGTWGAVDDCGKVAWLHPASDSDARHGQGAVAGMPPPDPAGAEHGIAQLLEHLLEVGRLP